MTVKYGKTDTPAIEIKFPDGCKTIEKYRIAAGLSLLTDRNVVLIDGEPLNNGKPHDAQIETYVPFSLLDAIIPCQGK